MESRVLTPHAVRAYVSELLSSDIVLVAAGLAGLAVGLERGDAILCGQLGGLTGCRRRRLDLGRLSLCGDLRLDAPTVGAAVIL